MPRDKEKRRQELLDAARDVFATKGFHEAKIEDIATKARVAKGTFYLYFADKRSIFVELVDSLFARLRAAILEVDVDGDVDRQIQHNIRAVIAVLLDDPGVTQLLLSYTAVPDQKFLQKIRSFYGGVRRLLAEALQRGQEMMIVAPGDTELFATFTLGALKETLLEIAMTGRSYSREQLVSELYGLLGTGYLRMEKPRR